MRKEELKDGVFYRALDYKDQIVQHNLLRPYDCRGYANSKWLDAGLICENANLWIEATLEELNALGDEHLPYSKYLQVSTPTHKFKVGDTVRCIDDCYWAYGKIATVVSVGLLGYGVNFLNDYDCETRNIIYYNDNELELVKSDNPNPEIQKQVEREAEQLMKPKELRRFKSGAVRSSDRGRLRPDYISPYALEEIADHFTQAAKEFGADDFATNYFKGIEPIDVKGSISRHYIDLQKAFAEKDDTKVREELRAMACNCIMALHQIRIVELGLYVEKFDKTEYITKD
jgi:RNase P subunit RPR2